MSRRVVGPFNRVEGDLEVQLDIDGDTVRDAWVVSPLYRGFEQMLHGKDPRDALVYTPRICGICSVSQSVAAALALADTQGLAMPPNGEAAVNLILANENVADHLTHFYLFFMPDFAREVYADEPWHPPVAARFRAVTGSAARQVLPARADFMHLMGLLAGKWPHTLAIQPGGTFRDAVYWFDDMYHDKYELTKLAHEHLRNNDFTYPNGLKAPQSVIDFINAENAGLHVAPPGGTHAQIPSQPSEGPESKDTPRQERLISG